MLRFRSLLLGSTLQAPASATILVDSCDSRFNELIERQLVNSTWSAMSPPPPRRKSSLCLVLTLHQTRRLRHGPGGPYHWHIFCEAIAPIHLLYIKSQFKSWSRGGTRVTCHCREKLRISNPTVIGPPNRDQVWCEMQAGHIRIKTAAACPPETVEQVSHGVDRQSRTFSVAI